MDVQIITPDKSLYDGKADLVTVPGTSGSIGILNNHAPLVSSLSKGEVKIVLDNKEEFFKIDGGVVEVLKNSVVVLAS
ncbi:ATP synthase F1 subunit epsilon [Flavobacteriales bacterium]|jgi:F-type H+-transporting ATPase subunit epsilon|nr:ATP synthase F1 subunit epsilon [Flavobacteriales bacterium]|tara:strand:- start:782 stop:1015 length:234 start_codon:yes stop_codon:yes gene_type:complete